jgi:mono/diheme cytochrome c family protein
MKRINIAIICVALFCFQCFAQKKQKVKYEFPPQMSEKVKGQFTELCDKGQVLYAINCSSCHNIKVKGKDVIPDFTQEKLIGYELRVSNGQHEENMPDTKVTAEELGLITTFLTYKKKN